MAPHESISTTLSLTLPVFPAKTFVSGVYVAFSVAVPDAGGVVIVNVHEPAPADAGVRITGDGVHVSPRPSVTTTLPVGVALPDVGATLNDTVIGFPTRASLDGRASP